MNVYIKNIDLYVCKETNKKTFWLKKIEIEFISYLISSDA